MECRIHAEQNLRIQHQNCIHSFGSSQIFLTMSPIVQLLIQSTSRYILASVFLLAAQARFTDRLTPAFYEYETSKTLRTQQHSWLRVSPWLHQRIVGIPVGLVGLGLLVPNSLNMPLPLKPPQPRESSALIPVVPLTMGITARVKGG
jgi:hypothetical protein